MNFKPRVWNTVAVRARLNTPGTADGLLSLTVNGETKQFDKMMWRKDNSMVITSLFFSTFYGGNSSDWLPEHTVYSYWDDFVVSTNAALMEELPMSRPSKYMDKSGLKVV